MKDQVNKSTHPNGFPGLYRRVVNVSLKCPTTVDIEAAIQELLECPQAAEILAKHRCQFDVGYDSHFYPEDFLNGSPKTAVGGAIPVSAMEPVNANDQ